jgi:hypothetical protein
VEVVSRRQPRGSGFYNYDKQYLTYWLIASAYRLRSLLGGNWSPVAVANAATATAFWLCTVMSWLLVTRRRRIQRISLLICFLATPIFIINPVYANCAIVSAGFLLLSGALMTRMPAAAVICFALAVGARGDAVLVAPILLWTSTPSRNWLARIFTRKITWAMVLAALVAILTGVSVYSGERQYSDLFDGMFQGRC